MNLNKILYTLLFWTKDGINKKLMKKEPQNLKGEVIELFKTIELKIVSVPYYYYFYWYFGTILLMFCMSRIILVSSILRHVGCTGNTKKMKYI